MNEEALNTLYSIAQKEGYSKSIEDFKGLMQSNQEAVSNMYEAAKKEGYSKSIEDFNVLVGFNNAEPQEELTPEMMETGQREAAPTYAMTEEKYAAEKKSAGESPLQDGVSADVVEEPVVEESVLTSEEKYPTVEDDSGESSKLIKSGVYNIASNLARIPLYLEEQLVTAFASDEQKEFLRSLPQEERESIIAQTFRSAGGADVSKQMNEFSKEMRKEAQKIEDTLIQYDQSITDDINVFNPENANLGRGVGRIATQAIGSIPSMIQAMTPGVGLVSVALSSAAAKSRELQEEGDALDWKTSANSAINGAAEGLLESVTKRIGGRFFKQLAGKAADTKIMNLKEFAKSFSKDFGAEGLSESATLAIQKASDYLLNEDYDAFVDSFGEFLETFLIGGVATGPLSAGGSGVTKLRQVAGKKKIDRVISDTKYESIVDAFRDVDAVKNMDDAIVSLTDVEISKPFLDGTLIGMVKNGEMTQLEAGSVMKNYNNAVEAKRSIEGLDIPEGGKKEAMRLVNEKKRINEEIAGKDEALTAPKRERITEINARLEQIARGEEVVAEEVSVEETTEPETDAQVEGAKKGISDYISELDTKARTELSIGETLQKVNNAEEINEAEINDAIDSIFNEIDRVNNSDASQQAKDAIITSLYETAEQLDNYEFTTETRTKTVTKSRTVENLGATAERVSVEGFFKDAAGTINGEETVRFNTDSGIVKATRKDGTEFILDTPSMIIEDDGISFDADGNLESVTVTDNQGNKVSFTGETAMDLAIKQRMNEIGSVPDAALQRIITEEVEVKEEVLKERQDAVQEQAAGEVPVQPETEAGKEVEEGAPEAEPEVTTEESALQEEVDAFNEIIDGTSPKFRKEGEDVSPEDYVNVEEVSEEMNDLDPMMVGYETPRISEDIEIDPIAEASDTSPIDPEILEYFGVKSADELVKGIEEFNGIPMVRGGMTDMLAAGEVKDSSGKPMKVGGGLMFSLRNAVNKGLAWAGVAESGAKTNYNDAVALYERNKDLFDRLWKEGKLPYGHVPMTITRMKDSAIDSNEAVFRFLIPKIKSLPKKNREKAFKLAMKDLKSLGKSDVLRVKKLVDKYSVTTLDGFFEAMVKDAEQRTKNEKSAIFSLDKRIPIARKLISTETTKQNKRPVTMALFEGLDPDYELLTFRNIYNSIGEKSVRNIPKGYVVGIVGIDVLNGGVGKADHGNYGYGPKGRLIALIKNPRHQVDIFPEIAARAASIAAEGGKSAAQVLGQATYTYFNLDVQQGQMPKTDADKVDMLIGLMRNAFPSVQAYTTKEEFSNILKQDGVREHLVDGIPILGLTKDGKIYINPDVRSINTPIHEFGHVWIDMLRSTEEGRDLLSKGLELVDSDPKAYEVAKRKYAEYDSDGNITNDELVREEALVSIIAAKGEGIVNAAEKSKFKSWLKALMEYVRKNFKTTYTTVGTGTNKEWVSLIDQIKLDELTIDEFTDLAIGDLFSGIKSPTDPVSSGQTQQSRTRLRKTETVAGVKITYPNEQQKKERVELRTDPEYVENTSDRLQEEDVDKLRKELDGEFGILTAENPMAQPLTEEENAALNKKGEQWLRKRGYDPRPVTGKYEQAENSFFVPRLTFDDAIAFAKEFNQESVAHSEGLVYQDGSINKRVKKDDNFSFEEYSPESNYVSVVKTKDGLKTFGIGYDDSKTMPVAKKVNATIDFRSRSGKMFSVSKEFNNQKHLDNYIKFRERKGDKEVGVTISDKAPSPVDAPKKRRFAKKAVFKTGTPLRGSATLSVRVFKPIMIDGKEFAEMSDVTVTNEKFSMTETDIYNDAVRIAIDEGLGGVVVSESNYNPLAVDDSILSVSLKDGMYVIKPKTGQLKFSKGGINNSSNNLSELVKTGRAAGISDAAIKKALLGRGFIESDIDSAMKAPSVTESVKVLKNRISKMKDNEEARKMVAKELRQLLKNSGMSKFSKSTVNKVITNLKNANVSNMLKMLDGVNDAIIRDRDRLLRYSRARKRSRAMKKIKSMGALKGLQEPLISFLKIDPSYLSKGSLSVYDGVIENLLNVNKKFSDRASREDLEMAVQMVVESFSNDLVRANGMVDNINASMDDDMSVSQNLSKLLKDGKISESDHELMTRFSDLLKDTEPSAAVSNDEINAERFERVKEDFEIAMSSLPDSLEGLNKDERSAFKFAKTLKISDLESMSTEGARRLVRGLEMLTAGIVSENLLKGKVIVEGKRDAASVPISETKESGIIDRIASSGRTALSNMFKGKRDRKTSVVNRLKSAPLRNIDQILRVSADKFKSTNIYKALFNPTAVAFSNVESTLKDVQKELENASGLLSKDQNKRFDQKVKIAMYQIQREYESNLGNKEVNPAIDWVESTLKDNESIYDDSEKESIKRILDKFTKDGQVDSESIFNSFTPNEKRALSIIDEQYQKMQEMSQMDAAMQGLPFIMRENYVHLPKVTNSMSQNTSDFDDMINHFSNPSLKNKALAQRNGKTHAISFDPVETAYSASRKAVTSYYMYPAVKRAKVAFAQMKENASSKKEMAIIESLEDVYDGIVRSQYQNVTKNRMAFENVVNFITKSGYLAQLGGPVKAAVELGVNAAHAIVSNPAEFVSGVKTLADSGIERSTFDRAIKNIPTTQKTRLSGEEDLTSKDVESRMMTNAKMFSPEERTGDFMSSAKVVGNVAKIPFESVIKLNESLISKPDTMIARPLFIGNFSSKFKEITGQSPNWEKIANDQAYRERFEFAISEASYYADQSVVDSVASNNPFEGIPKNIRDANDSAIRQAFSLVNRYMTRFRVFEYYSAVKAIQALVGRSDITRFQGLTLLTATVLRMAMYKMAIDTVFSMVYEELEISDDDDEELEQEVTRNVLGAIATLALGRSFGNLAQIPMMFGAEYLNKEYGEGITREGEYDRHKDGMVFTKLSVDPKPNDDIVKDAFISSLGAYTPMVKTLDRGVTLYQRSKVSKKESTRQRNLNELYERIPFEIAGNLGIIPGYKELRKLYIENMVSEKEKEEGRKKRKKREKRERR